MSSVAHVPIRQCLGCGQRAPQAAMWRVCANLDGELMVDQRRHGGRGGYLHRAPECWRRFAARQGQVRSLRCSVSKSARAALVRELQRLDQSAMMGER